jgi:hypothetical protein
MGVIRQSDKERRDEKPGMWFGDEQRGRAMSRAARKSACVALPAAAALLLGACGGSSSSPPPPSSSPDHSASSASAAAVAATHGVVGGRVQVGRGVIPISKFLGADRVRPTRRGAVRARAQAGMIDDEVSTTGAKTLDPCSLVTRTQAQAIIGKPVGQPVDAPQGPTCVYTARGFKGPITFAVVATDFSTVKPQAQLRDRMSVTVGGRPAYCGVAGSPTMVVPLTPGKFLTVVAPCPIAASLAATALDHLNA